MAEIKSFGRQIVAQVDMDQGLQAVKLFEEINVRNREAPVQRKRVAVDSEGKEVTTSKRARAPVNLDFKRDALRYLIHQHGMLGAKAGVIGYNVAIWCDITSIIQTLHTKDRQTANGTGNMRNLDNDHEFTIAGKHFGFKDIYEEYGKIRDKWQIPYAGKTEDAKNIIGTLSSILALFATFRPRWNELRLGNGKIACKKANDQDTYMDVNTFGLNAAHHQLCVGNTFTPTLQSSQKQSLGPMTIVINLCRTVDPKYQDGWKSAFINCFKLFPFYQEMAGLLAGSGTTYTPIIKLLADISLFGTTRFSHKAAIPMAAVLYSVTVAGEWTNWWQGARTDMPPVDLPEIIGNMDFSGRGMWRFYTIDDVPSGTINARLPIPVQNDSATWYTKLIHTENGGKIIFLEFTGFQKKYAIKKEHRIIT